MQEMLSESIYYELYQRSDQVNIMFSSEFIIYKSSVLGHSLCPSVVSVISCIVLWGKLKQISLLFSFHFMASSNLAGLFVPAEKESWYHFVLHKHVAYVPRLHFVRYSLLTLRINILCPSFSHAPHYFFLFFFFVVVPDIFQKSRKLPAEQLHQNTLISFISVIC